MTTPFDKTVFIEYSSAKKGQHFMTVIQTVDHKRIIIGRIYRKYDKENKQTNYLATDWMGNPAFIDTHDLTTLKKKFKDNGKGMAMLIPKMQTKNVQMMREASPQKRTEREKELKDTREHKKPEKNLEKPKEEENFKEPDDFDQFPEPNEIESDREKELDDIREQNYQDDREQDQEQEQDMEMGM
jgi:hypothetical protein